MKYFINKLLLLLLVGLFPFFHQAQACTFTSTGTGLWTNPATWTNSCQNPNLSLPGINDDVIIKLGDVVTLNSITTVQVASVTLLDGGGAFATLVVSGSSTNLIIGPTGGTNANVLVLGNKANLQISGALVTVTGGVVVPNNGNAITSGTTQGYLLVERCARRGNNCVNTNNFVTGSLVYCVRCPDAICDDNGNPTDGIQVESTGGCRTILLPVTLTKLDAIYKANEGISIEWATVNEIDNDYFEIEHSFTGESFKSISKINGFGNTTSIKEYNFLDTEFSVGINYYRLKQVDFNGAFTYTKVVAAVGKSLSKQNILVYPNPTDGTALSLQLLNKNEVLSLEVFTMMGVSVYFYSANNDKQNLELKFATKLPKGIYAVKIQTKEGVSIERFLVE
jgi:hypothetical protein